MNVNGTDTPNHNARSAIRVLKGTAAELPFTQNIKFIIKNKPNTILKKSYNLVIYIYVSNISDKRKVILFQMQQNQQIIL